MSPLPLQIKSDRSLRVHGAAAPFTLTRTGSASRLCIDGRDVALRAHPSAPVERIAQQVARVPRGLRDLLLALWVSPTPNPSDEAWAQEYGLPVASAMGALASGSGDVVIYPQGLAQLDHDDPDLFARNLMHELGHCWSLRDWAADAAARAAWLAAIASDAEAPSQYAQRSFRHAGLPFEDAAEATALYFLVLGTPAFARHAAAMPGRFALLRRRFGPVS